MYRELQSHRSPLFSQLFPDDSEAIVKRYLKEKSFSEHGIVFEKPGNDGSSDALTSPEARDSLVPADDSSALFSLRARNEWDYLDHSITAMVESKVSNGLKEQSHQIADRILLRSMVEAVEAVYASLFEEGEGTEVNDQR